MSLDLGPGKFFRAKWWRWRAKCTRQAAGRPSRCFIVARRRSQSSEIISFCRGRSSRREPRPTLTANSNPRAPGLSESGRIGTTSSPVIHRSQSDRLSARVSVPPTSKRHAVGFMSWTRILLSSIAPASWRRKPSCRRSASTSSTAVWLWWPAFWGELLASLTTRTASSLKC